LVDVYSLTQFRAGVFAVKNGARYVRHLITSQDRHTPAAIESEHLSLSLTILLFSAQIVIIN
jgi:hypothetical protein